MTVAELIEELKKMPQDALVIEYGGDEYYHLATYVELQDTNSDIQGYKTSKDYPRYPGPFVSLG